MTRREATPWVAMHPAPFVAKRIQLRREERGGLVRYGVRAYHAVVARVNEEGKREVERCPHQHSKAKAARQCAERAARRFNKDNQRKEPTT